MFIYYLVRCRQCVHVRQLTFRTVDKNIKVRREKQCWALWLIGLALLVFTSFNSYVVDDRRIMIIFSSSSFVY